MAQNECQEMPKEEFYAKIRNLNNKIYNLEQEKERASEFLASMDGTTITNMGIDNDTRDDLIDLRTAYNESTDFYDGTATTRTIVLKDIVNKLRYI